MDCSTVVEANEGKKVNMCPLFTVTQDFNAVSKEKKTKNKMKAKFAMKGNF